jgi:cobalt-zinc-cadmium efflux system membrane fusion protein
MSFPRSFTPILPIIAAVLFVGCNSAQSDPSAQASPVPVASGFFKPTDQQWENLSIASVRRMEVPDVNDTDGSITPADDATTQVFSSYTGRVAKVFVTVGDTVRAGRPLFAIAGSEFAQAQNDLSASVQTRDAARIQLRVTQANRARLLKLATIDGAARKDVEQSAADLANAKATLRNDETALALVRSRLRVLGKSDAEIDDLEKNPAEHTLPTDVVVAAPVGGVVTQRAIGVGQYVESAASGATNPLLTITDFSRVFFVAGVREADVTRIRIGDDVSVMLQAFPNHIFHAHVRYIAPSIDQTTHRIFVRSEVANPDGALKTGMFGAFRIAAGAPSTEVVVPQKAVVFEGEDDARVWLVGPNKTLALRHIRAGKTVDGMVVVSDGLQAGDHVVTSGSVFIDRASQGGI